MFVLLLIISLFIMYPVKKCKECGDALLGRSDKRFCTDLCRNVYHNRERISETEKMREVNIILSRNRRILKTCLEGRSSKIPLSYLYKRGFDFNYFTHQVKDKEGELVVFCYEVGYQQMDNDKIAVQKEQCKSSINF